MDHLSGSFTELIASVRTAISSGWKSSKLMVMRAAQKLDNVYGIEVWDQARLVGRFLG
jgi:hypothetical protein